MQMPLFGLDPSMLIRYLCKTEVDWISLQCWSLVDACTMKRRTLTAGLVMQVSQIDNLYIDKPPSWSGTDDRLKSISDPDEKEDIPEYKDSCVGDEYRDTREDEEEEGSDQVFDVGEGSIGDHLSLCVASKCIQSRGSTEDAPVGPVTSSAAPTTGGSCMISHKVTAVDFSHMISSDSADLTTKSG